MQSYPDMNEAGRQSKSAEPVPSNPIPGSSRVNSAAGLSLIAEFLPHLGWGQRDRRHGPDWPPSGQRRIGYRAWLAPPTDERQRMGETTRVDRDIADGAACFR